MQFNQHTRHYFFYKLLVYSFDEHNIRFKHMTLFFNKLVVCSFKCCHKFVMFVQISQEAVATQIEPALSPGPSCDEDWSTSLILIRRKLKTSGQDQILICLKWLVEGCGGGRDSRVLQVVGLCSHKPDYATSVGETIRNWLVNKYLII